MSGMGFPGTGYGPPDHNPMSQAPNFVSHMMKPMGMDMAPPTLNPRGDGTCCSNAGTFDCLCHLIDSDAKGFDVDDIYQVLGRDHVLKSSVLEDIDLYLECDDDNVYTKAMPPKPGMDSTKPKNTQEPFKFKFSFPTNTTSPASDSKKSFVCEFCSQSFIKDHLLKNHQAKTHNVKDLFPCPQCAYRGQQHAHLQKHIKRMHKKSSQSDLSHDSTNNLAKNVTVVPPKTSEQPVEQVAVKPMADTTDTLHPCNTPTLKSEGNWPVLSNNNEKPVESASVLGTGTESLTAQNNAGSGNGKISLSGKTESFQHVAPSPQQTGLQEQKITVAYNCQQSTPTRPFGAEPSPGSRSMPECSPRPGSRQSGHESSSDFSILDISNNTFKPTETATFLSGESFLSQLEGPETYHSAKVDQIAFAVPSPHSIHPPPSPVTGQVNSAGLLMNKNLASNVMNYGSAGMNPGQMFPMLQEGNPQSAPVQVMNQGQTFSIAQGGKPLPGSNTCMVNANQNFTARSPPSYPPRIAPTPPEMIDPTQHMVSPVPHASGRNSASSVGNMNQCFLSPSPTSCVPRVAPTPPDMSRPQMSPMSQGSSQHSSPSIVNVNQGFLSPSPPISQPRIVQTPPDSIRHQMSPTFQRSSPYPAMNVGQSFPSQMPPTRFPRSAPTPPESPRHQVMPGILGHPRPTRLPINSPPQPNATRPQMSPVHQAGLPPTYRPMTHVQHVTGQHPNSIPHSSQLDPGQGFYPQNGPRFQGQYNMGGHPVNNPYGGLRFPQHMSYVQGPSVMNAQGPSVMNVQRPSVMNVQRPGTKVNPACPSSAGPRNPGPSPNYMNTAGPNPGYPQQMQGQMYIPRQQQPVQRFTYQVQRHPYGAVFDSSGQFEGMGPRPQGNIMQTTPHNVAATCTTPQGVHGHSLQQTRPAMITRIQNPGQPNQAQFNEPYRNLGYISRQGQCFQQQSMTSSMEYRPPLSQASLVEKNDICSGQTPTASGMMNLQVSQGSTNSASVLSNIGQQSQQTGLPQSQGNRFQAQRLGSSAESDSGENINDQSLLSPKTSSEGNRTVAHINSRTCGVQGVGQVNILPTINPVQKTRSLSLMEEEDSSLQTFSESVELCETKTQVENKNSLDIAEKMDINENQNLVERCSVINPSISGAICPENNDANGKNLLKVEKSADEKVNDKISWLLLQCGVSRPSDNKMGNPEVCRLEIKTSEEEIGPVVHIMETQEVEGEVENILDNISQSESDATQSDSVLPIMSPQMSDEVFSPLSNNMNNSPPKLSRIESMNSESSEFKCEKCDFVCASKQFLKSHEHHRHNPNRKIYKCETCSVELKQKVSYESHMAKHNGELNYECNVCHKLFANRLSFNLHLKTHNTERPFMCEMDMCNKAFRTRSDLNEHAKVVHGEKIHKCSYPMCEKAYTLEKDLRAHQVSHTFALKCSWPRCRKTFRDKFNLNNHYKTHTKEKTIKCSLCDFKCIQRSSLDSHLKNHHPGNA